MFPFLSHSPIGPDRRMIQEPLIYEYNRGSFRIQVILEQCVPNQVGTDKIMKYKEKIPTIKSG